MNIRDVQRLLAAAKLYTGGIDGDAGPRTMGATERVLKGYPKTPKVWKDWPQWRQLIAAGQIVLDQFGFEPGAIDGLLGHNTAEALAAWEYESMHGTREKVERVVERDSPPPSTTRFPHQKKVNAFYGAPGTAVQSQLTRIDLPMRFRIDWNLDQTVSVMTLHRKCADSATDALNAIFKHYGEEKLRELGLDRFAGSYNHRRMRGGRSWSMHAYGCAIDFYAAPNGLRTRCPQALFCKSEYETFFDIWEDHGWTSLGRAIGRDWMHVQAAYL